MFMSNHLDNIISLLVIMSYCFVLATRFYDFSHVFRRIYEKKYQNLSRAYHIMRKYYIITGI